MNPHGLRNRRTHYAQNLPSKWTKDILGGLLKQIILSWQNPLTKTKQNYFLQKQSVKPTPWYQQLLWVLIVSSFRSWTSQEWEGIVNLCWEHIHGTLRVPRVLNVELTSMKKCMFENWEWWRLLVQLPAAESWSALLLLLLLLPVKTPPGGHSPTTPTSRALHKHSPTTQYTHQRSPTTPKRALH